jgi:hypothetical protein
MIGDILLEHGWVSWEQLAVAVNDQADLADRGARASSRIRLCSMLVSRGVVDFDHASRALGEHFGCAAALRRHLERRDRSVASLLPPESARRLIVLPIGRLAGGALIVCARDPSPELQAALARALGQDVVIAVAPASYLERLVERTYPSDIDLPIEVGDAISDVEPLSEFEIQDASESDLRGASDFDIEVDDSAGAQGDDFAIDVELGDARTTPAAPKHKPLPVQIKPIARAATDAPRRDSLDATIASFPDIDDLEWLLDVVMGYVAKRWAAAVLLAISDKRAVGVRGHGRRIESKVRTFVVPLSEPSLVQLARDERRVVDEPPLDTARVHGSVLAALDNPLHPIAAPVVKNAEVHYVLVVGDPVEGDNTDALPDVEVLAEAMSEAIARL